MTLERLAKILIEDAPVRYNHREGDDVPDRKEDKGDEDEGEQGETEKDDSGRGKINPKVAVYINRLMLRLFSVPSLITYLDDIGVVPGEQDEVTIQLDFHRLPDEILQQVSRLIAPTGKMKLKRYVKKGSARLGFEFGLSPKDLKGEDYDYAL